MTMASQDLSKVTLLGSGEGCVISRFAYLDTATKWASKLLEMGDYVVIARGAELLCHESYACASDCVSHWGRIRLEAFSAVNDGAFVGPGVHMGVGSILAAGAYLIGPKVIPPMEIWGGVPAKRIGSVYDLLAKRLSLVEDRPHLVDFDDIAAAPLGTRLSYCENPRAAEVRTAKLNEHLHALGLPRVVAPPEQK